MRTAKSATPIAMIVFFFLMFIGGIFFPVDIMPKGLEYVSNALPSTHFNNALRIVLVEGKSIVNVWLELVVVGSWMMGCLALSIKFFRWEYRIESVNFSLPVNSSGLIVLHENSGT